MINKTYIGEILKTNDCPEFIKCKDGTFSTSKGKGACSRHGGVLVFEKKSEVPKKKKEDQRSTPQKKDKATQHKHKFNYGDTVVFRINWSGQGQKGTKGVIKTRKPKRASINDEYLYNVQVGTNQTGQPLIWKSIPESILSLLHSSKKNRQKISFEEFVEMSGLTPDNYLYRRVKNLFDNCFGEKQSYCGDTELWFWKARNEIEYQVRIKARSPQKVEFLKRVLKAYDRVIKDYGEELLKYQNTKYYHSPVQIDLSFIPKPKRGNKYTIEGFEKALSKIYASTSWNFIDSTPQAIKDLWNDVKEAQGIFLGNLKLQGRIWNIDTCIDELSPFTLVDNIFPLNLRKPKYYFNDLPYDLSIESHKLKDRTYDNLIDFFTREYQKELKEAYYIINTISREVFKVDSLRKYITQFAPELKYPLSGKRMIIARCIFNFIPPKINDIAKAEKYFKDNTKYFPGSGRYTSRADYIYKALLDRTIPFDMFMKYLEENEPAAYNDMKIQLDAPTISGINDSVGFIPTNLSGAAIAAGFAAGAAYFYLGESKQSKSNNCSYFSPASTDVLAFLGGGIVAAQGYLLRKPLLSFIGTAIVSIHLHQYQHFKNSK